ncbi:hypothetical protein [Kitasatospora sp. NPDC085879]|uniref:hypothetical protein n=1 Tax=Kitasatospora sp. NPDC085879 TaxID=3154769 RepID=UPI00341AD5B9
MTDSSEWGHFYRLAAMKGLFREGAAGRSDAESAFIIPADYTPPDPTELRRMCASIVQELNREIKARKEHQQRKERRQLRDLLDKHEEWALAELERRRQAHGTQAPPGGAGQP